MTEKFVNVAGGEKKKCPNCGRAWAIENEQTLLLRSVRFVHIDKKTKMILTVKCQCHQVIELNS